MALYKQYTLLWIMTLYCIIYISLSCIYIYIHMHLFMHMCMHEYTYTQNSRRTLKTISCMHTFTFYMHYKHKYTCFINHTLRKTYVNVNPPVLEASKMRKIKVWKISSPYWNSPKKNRNGFAILYFLVGLQLRFGLW